MTTPSSPATALRGGTGPLLLVVLAGQFMAILDATIVTVAAPSVRADLGASGAALQFVVAGYTVVYAVLLVTGARLGRMFGHRRLFLIGLALFTVASLACGLAGTTERLVAFRLFQGGGAALMVPQVLSLIQLAFAGAARARAVSAYTTVLAGGAVTGQVLGGVLTGADIAGSGWRPVFLVNVPIGLVLLVAAARLLPVDRLPADRARGARGLDLPGLLTLSCAVLLLVVPLTVGHEWGWPVECLLMLAGSAVFFGVFAVTQRAAAVPLLPRAVLRAPGAVPATMAVFLMMAGYAGFLFAMTLYFQGGLGLSPLAAGLAFVLPALGFGLVGLNWRRVPARYHHGLVPAALAVSAAGYAGVALVASGLGPAGPLYQLSATLAGAGMGAAYGPALHAALSRVAPRDAADASGLAATATQLGQAVGVAVLGGVYLAMAPSATSSGTAGAGAAVNLVAACLMLLAGLCAAFIPRR
ncbi:MFS transporter [Streptomyces uncialis]|uniref:MFS transporter n=1 Tax=Streptomyces uncialis TaxID=1048205 RepID=UPI0033CE4944